MTHPAKALLRSQLLAARRSVPDHVRQHESEHLCAHLADALGEATIVAAYVPIGGEPGSIGGEPGSIGGEPGSPAILDTLAKRCATVLLPVARTGPDGEHLPLQWGRYVPGRLVAGRFGLREPAEPWLPASALSDAQVVLVPALAVDRRGVRLGRGGGFYDRSLPLCAPDARLVAVVRDTEILDRLDAEPHDVPMTHALTPGRGLLALDGGPLADGGSST
ncbi:5-formyltetrahydrofolate cyclo-ligase [Mycolicibacterium sp.]|uniref:5-formyltetrahydrofolate cyclo-ligase n=1 Tax=Mycolicibacterium sp. TaxID=2320850 RepID=UPI0028B02649|nr:5-formyltetrahydrofolate cyclo-ligase [Mycolicibacterium sp.]